MHDKSTKKRMKTHKTRIKPVVNPYKTRIKPVVKKSFSIDYFQFPVLSAI